jgi:Spy/CpxP family protein refolding chaperone
VDQIVERIMAYDKNKDGKVTRDELPERMQHLVKLGDTNKDGVLDKEEIKKLATRLANQGRFGGFGGRRGRGGPRGGPGGPDFRDRPDPVANALRDVKLYEEQKKKVEAIRTAHEKKVRDLFQKARDGDLEFSKVREEVDKLKKDMLKEMKAALTGEQFAKFEKALENAPPRGRGGPGFGFGGRPGRGFPGFGPDQVANALKDLKLSEEPKKKAEAIRTAHEKKVRAVFQKARDGDLDFREVREETDKLKKDLLKEMKAVLTGEQFKQFEKALDRAPPRGRGGPGGGPRGRGRRDF